MRREAANLRILLIEDQKLSVRWHPLQYFQGNVQKLVFSLRITEKSVFLSVFPSVFSGPKNFDKIPILNCSPRIGNLWKNRFLPVFSGFIPVFSDFYRFFSGFFRFFPVFFRFIQFEPVLKPVFIRKIFLILVFIPVLVRKKTGFFPVLNRPDTVTSMDGRLQSSDIIDFI